MNKSVHKFGGSSLSSAARYHAVANIIISHCQLGDSIVVSAAGKTTNTLVKLWQCYQQNDAQGICDVVKLLKNHQVELISELLIDEQQVHALGKLNIELDAITQLAQQNKLIEAQLLAHGEVWSSRLLAQYLTQLDYKAHSFDARDLLLLKDGQLQHDTNQKSCEVLNALQFNVVTGFIAKDIDGETVTLGRNGSDYSATLIARYCNAQSVTIWTDTQGVYSTDPRKVKHAIKYSKVCREQANLLARLGNPVLHAKTLTPLKETDIKLVVRSSFDSHSGGTEIVKKGSAKQKHFLTTLDNHDLVKIEELADGEIGELSQLIQHSLHHFDLDGDTYLLIPASYTHTVINHLSGRANLIESNLFGLGIVCPNSVAQQLTEQASKLLQKYNINVRFAFSQKDLLGNEYGLVLCEQAFDTDLLTVLHDELISDSQELAVIVAGLGNVGATFIEQLEQQLIRLNQLIPVKLVGLVRSKSMLFNTDGIALSDWQPQWQNTAVSYEKETLINQLEQLDYEHKVVIDITASEEFSLLYPDFASQNCHLISANKYAGTAQTSWYDSLREKLSERNLKWRYNTSVGAGLPINFALNDLQHSGDKVERLSGVFSGTLSWLCCEYDGAAPFSELLLQAKGMGYTEPDPREDLSGRDVQRKLLILAREVGLSLDLDDIELTPMMPLELTQGDWQSFLDKRDVLDVYMDEKLSNAAKDNLVLRYVAELNLTENKLIAKVGLSAVAKDDPLATLKAGDNIFVINSQWYQENALVIQGPGAGKEVTAAGIHSDLYWLTNSLVK
ncbi:bifunctional aspartate kinase/homoserine dehydrogenase II [Pseudoalteromonas sp. C2R02]|uniref:bifunctional aspartate kinase/homoserine dehydrogenase II n=1 Tax=Pseudoalteromonas sp. C2R02 TaxID=2841565 RepID=UPI001C098A68|nr:bifunctional aspartate kinase/homoserine dehydrogenase II [Pseudoalteromonas sp. C2R02]MBU2969528.1 bifunctional aspartate kinase/homoserine dehydrogenase II [Pseudoalteromonas sp. C2R02]